VSKELETINLGILKGYYPFSGFQRQSLWWGWRGNAPHCTKRSAKGEFQNSPVDCFERGNALQERVFHDGAMFFERLGSTLHLTIMCKSYFPTVIA